MVFFVPPLYGLYVGATAAAPFVVRALNSPATKRVADQGLKLVGKFKDKSQASRVANWFHRRIVTPASVDSTSGFAGASTEIPQIVPLVEEAGELGSMVGKKVGPFIMSQVKPEDFATGLTQKDELIDMDDVKAVIDTASNFDGATPEEVKDLVEQHLLTGETS